jgi:hypothetical protein
MKPNKGVILMLKKTSALIVFILFIAVGVAQGQVSLTYSAMGIQYFTMTVPDDWRVNVGSETSPSEKSDDRKQPNRLISAMPNSEVPLWFGIWVPEHLENIDGAEEYMVSLGLDLLSDVVTTGRKSETLNDMDVYYVSGTGKKEGEPMDFRAAFLQLPQDRVVIAIYIGPRESTKNHGEELVQMIHSLQPVAR